MKRLHAILIITWLGICIACLCAGEMGRAARRWWRKRHGMRRM